MRLGTPLLNKSRMCHPSLSTTSESVGRTKVEKLLSFVRYRTHFVHRDLFIINRATTVVVMNLRDHRNALGISQSRLARASGVSRFKICTFELGNGSLRSDEQECIVKALAAEADRLRSIPAEMDLRGLDLGPSVQTITSAKASNFPAINGRRQESLK